MIDKLLRFAAAIFRDFPTSFFVGFLVVFALGTILFLAVMGGSRGGKWSARLLLIEYLFLLIVISVLLRKVHTERKFDFVPFWSYRAIRDGRVALLTQNIANVIAFIPIGLLLGCVIDRMKWWKVLLIGLGFSVMIEFLQFVLKRGFTEFDDVFHNVLGCMIGFAVYVGIESLKKNSTKNQIER